MLQLVLARGVRVHLDDEKVVVRVEVHDLGRAALERAAHILLVLEADIAGGSKERTATIAPATQGS